MQRLITPAGVFSTSTPCWSFSRPNCCELALPLRLCPTRRMRGSSLVHVGAGLGCTWVGPQAHKRWLSRLFPVHSWEAEHLVDKQNKTKNKSIILKKGHFVPGSGFNPVRSWLNACCCCCCCCLTSPFHFFEGLDVQPQWKRKQCKKTCFVLIPPPPCSMK